MAAPSIRVIHVITRLIVGGAQENTIATVQGLRQRPDLKVELLAGPTTGSEGSLEPLVSRDPDLFTRLPHLIRPIAPWHDLLALRGLIRIFRDRRPTIVHTHSGKAGILGRLAAGFVKTPVVIHTIHGPSFGPFQGAGANALYRWLERRAARYTTHFISVADAMTRRYLAAGIGRTEDFTRILSGFHLDPYLQASAPESLRRKLGLTPDDFVVGKIARFFHLKGHDDLFRIMPHLLERSPRMKFLLIGDGPWRARFEDWAARMGLRDRVIFTGLVPPDAIPQHIALMDVLVHLSKREGLPRTLPQALAAGRPIIAYDCDGAAEVCREGETGLLVSPGDLQTLGERLLTLEADPTLRKRLGESGREWVRRHFSLDQMIEAIDRLYRRLLGSSNPQR